MSARQSRNSLKTLMVKKPLLLLTGSTPGRRSGANNGTGGVVGTRHTCGDVSMRADIPLETERPSRFKSGPVPLTGREGVAGMKGMRCDSLRNDRCLHGFPTDGACCFAKAQIIEVLPFCMREEVCGRL